MTFGWASYLQAATTAPIEVLAVIQYLSTAHWAHDLYRSNGTLSGGGIIAAVILMSLFVVLNLFGIRLADACQQRDHLVEGVDPGVHDRRAAGDAFPRRQFHRGRRLLRPTAPRSRASSSRSRPGALSFALLGFEQAVQLGGEAANPKRDLPRAVILSILIGAGIYFLLQVAFIGSVQPDLLASAHTWTNLGPGNHDPAVVALNAGPFYTVTRIAGLAWLAFILRLDAVICPFGSGLIYSTTSSRISSHVAQRSRTGQFEKYQPGEACPVFGILFTTASGCCSCCPSRAGASLSGSRRAPRC